MDQLPTAVHRFLEGADHGDWDGFEQHLTPDARSCWATAGERVVCEGPDEIVQDLHRRWGRGGDGAARRRLHLHADTVAVDFDGVRTGGAEPLRGTHTFRLHDGRIASLTTTAERDLVGVARELGPVLAAGAGESDRAGRLARTSLGALRDAGFLRLYVPRALGGLELDPLSHAQVQEELARHDSAAAWILQAAGSSAWWCSRLPAETVDEIYATGADQVIAVSFAEPVEAEPVDGGLRISGQRSFASNVSDASWVWLTAVTNIDGDPAHAGGAPVVRAVFFPAGEARVVPTWDTLGMRGSDSNDVAVDGIVVPERRSFRIGIDHAPGPRYDGALYRLPAVVTVASYVPAVALGVARAAIDDVMAIAADRTPFASATRLAERATAQAKLGRAEGALRSARAYLHDRISWAWEETLAGRELTQEERAEVLLACVQAHAASVAAVDLSYSVAGTTGIHRRHRLERLFRDVNVLRHQGFVSESRFETVAQVWLGLPPDLAFIAL